MDTCAQDSTGRLTPWCYSWKGYILNPAKSHWWKIQFCKRMTFPLTLTTTVLLANPRQTSHSLSCGHPCVVCVIDAARGRGSRLLLFVMCHQCLHGNEDFALWLYQFKMLHFITLILGCCNIWWQRLHKAGHKLVALVIPTLACRHLILILQLNHIWTV